MSYAMEGQQDGKGKDIMFATKDPGTIKFLDAKMDSGEKAQIDYRVVVNKTDKGEFTNYNIVAVSPVK